MLTLEMLPEKVEGFPVLYDKRVKVFKEKYSVQYTCDRVVESLDFAEHSNFIRESSNWEYNEDSCFKKLVPFSMSDVLTKFYQINSIFTDVILDFGNFTKPIRSSQMLFLISID